MAAKESRGELDLRGNRDATERSNDFWNASIIAMKFSVERQWIKTVRNTRKKPNYGMGDMDSLHEEMVDCYLEELGNALKYKRSRSKATGLANSIVLFIPWPVFKHFIPLTSGYGANVGESSTRKNAKKNHDNIFLRNEETNSNYNCFYSKVK